MNMDTDIRKFEESMNRFTSQNEISEACHFTDDEIRFMWKFNLKAFLEKYPGVAEYYMEILDC